MVYLHKIECMRQMRSPEPWPPDTTGEPALSLLDRHYAEMRAEFGARPPDGPAHTWYLSEQTVGFWYRRMAQETVIHRVDAEQALGEPLAPIPADLAVDGIDEVLVRFLSYGSVLWREEFEKLLPAAEPPPVLVRTGDHAWTVRVTPDGVLVGPPLPEAGATISGSPEQVLLWLWRRADGGVDRSGDQELIDTVHTLLYTATQ